ncbi:MAG TPA: rhomboid family intramembrane serine protease [Steroidobacteraceae bacterium]|nr:rhomboid family intramembrane serine protease [Steroidobacteraceae bacterium]HRX90740.1 rhomboid family intramembrane serine protease [Steroidobacteraceae bacterium]
MFKSLPPVTRWLLFANVGVFLLGMLGLEPLLVSLFALWPLQGPFRPWQIVTYAFLHGSYLHLFFNMFGVYMFGSEIERALGARRFVEVYVSSVVIAAVAQLIVTTYVFPAPYPTLGASGGLFGILLAFGLMFPQRRIMLLIPPIPMKAWVFVTLYGLIELGLGFSRAQTGVAHFAHLGGMLGGFLALRNQGRRRPFS